jgi:formamidopyrimidine-DNA glycosylase
MPELPEVETVVRSISPLLINTKIESAWTSGLPLHMQKVVDDEALKDRVVGATVNQVRRRGKYILLDLIRGKLSSIVLIHLGMSGKLMITRSSEERRPHTHVVLGLKGSQELRFVDPRRFGQFKVAASQDELTEIADMGPEPLDDLGLETFALSLSKSKAPIKAFLLDQRRIAGLGNIYVSEALFEARVHPSRPALRVKRQAPALLEAVKLVLRKGIENRGTTLRDYVDGKGVAGNNKHALQVYGREGQPCTRCDSVIRRSVDAGRSTFFCPVCQKRT